MSSSKRSTKGQLAAEYKTANSANALLQSIRQQNEPPSAIREPAKRKKKRLERATKREKEQLDKWFFEALAAFRPPTPERRRRYALPDDIMQEIFTYSSSKTQVLFMLTSKNGSRDAVGRFITTLRFSSSPPLVGTLASFSSAFATTAPCLTHLAIPAAFSSIAEIHLEILLKKCAPQLITLEMSRPELFQYLPKCRSLLHLAVNSPLSESDRFESYLLQQPKLRSLIVHCTSQMNMNVLVAIAKLQHRPQRLEIRCKSFDSSLANVLPQSWFRDLDLTLISSSPAYAQLCKPQVAQDSYKWPRSCFTFCYQTQSVIPAVIGKWSMHAGGKCCLEFLQTVDLSFLPKHQWLRTIISMIDRGRYSFSASDLVSWISRQIEALCADDPEWNFWAPLLTILSAHSLLKPDEVVPKLQEFAKSRSVVDAADCVVIATRLFRDIAGASNAPSNQVIYNWTRDAFPHVSSIDVLFKLPWELRPDSWEFAEVYSEIMLSKSSEKYLLLMQFLSEHRNFPQDHSMMVSMRRSLRGCLSPPSASFVKSFHISRATFQLMLKDHGLDRTLIDALFAHSTSMIEVMTSHPYDWLSRASTDLQPNSASLRAFAQSTGKWKQVGRLAFVLFKFDSTQRPFLNEILSHSPADYDFFDWISDVDFSIYSCRGWMRVYMANILSGQLGDAHILFWEKRSYRDRQRFLKCWHRCLEDSFCFSYEVAASLACASPARVEKLFSLSAVAKDDLHLALQIMKNTISTPYNAWPKPEAMMDQICVIWRQALAQLFSPMQMRYEPSTLLELFRLLFSAAQAYPALCATIQQFCPKILEMDFRTFRKTVLPA